MEYVLYGLAYIGIGHLLSAVFLPKGKEAPNHYYSLLWWTLWPLGLVLTLAGRAGLRLRDSIAASKEAKPAARASIDRIAELERELGMNTSGSGFSGVPREFPTLPGVSPEACLLPTFESELDFKSRYGFHTQDVHANLLALQRSLNELLPITNEFAQLAQTTSGQELVDAAEVALRRIGRIEQGAEPLVAGLTYASYGRARKACIDARSEVGNILDSSSISDG
ncbi:MAG: hypothetical protein Q4G35_04795 [Propionibacteriaceae bacterium]|nr:hypothetical protein [Propionibacteriaceae bacterium]